MRPISWSYTNRSPQCYLPKLRTVSLQCTVVFVCFAYFSPFLSCTTYGQGWDSYQTISLQSISQDKPKAVRVSLFVRCSEQNFTVWLVILSKTNSCHTFSTMNIAAISVFTGKPCPRVKSFSCQNKPCLEVVFLNLPLQNSNIRYKIPVVKIEVTYSGLGCWKIQVHGQSASQLMLCTWWQNLQIVLR